MQKRDIRLDRVLILIACAIFATLFGVAYLLFSFYTLISIVIGAAIVFYQLLSLKGNLSAKFKHGEKLPSTFLLFLLFTPVALGILVSFDSYSINESLLRAILVWGLTLTFWSTLLFVPLALYSKYKEELLPSPNDLQRVTLIVPAYNEEKVIERTIEGLLATQYQKKEIIVIDDGSKDRTFEIAQRYKNEVKVLHKSNGGKASAINYGLSYATGDIVVIVDADTIIGRESLMHVVKGFAISKDVAAVAGNIKVRNRMNWLTWCQAIEYVAGIQIVRRALDVFGAISVVPGALGAFRRSALGEIGTYDKDTIVEDFDLTVKILKSKLVIQGSTKATAYTEAPQTMRGLYNQRKRWYGGNLEVFTRHSDALVNPRYGLLQRFVFPFMIFSSVVMPFVGLVAWANAIIAIIYGDGIFVLALFAIFSLLQCLQAALAVRLDNEDPKLIPYAIFLVVGFKQILDVLLILATLRWIFKRKARWTSAERIGI